MPPLHSSTLFEGSVQALPSGEHGLLHNGSGLLQGEVQGVGASRPAGQESPAVPALALSVPPLAVPPLALPPLEFPPLATPAMPLLPTMPAAASEPTLASPELHACSTSATASRMTVRNRARDRRARFDMARE